MLWRLLTEFRGGDLFGRCRYSLGSEKVPQISQIYTDLHRFFWAIAVRSCKKAINDGLQTDMDNAIVIEEKLFGNCFETEDQKAGMGNFLEKDKEKKLKVVPFQNK